MADAYKLKADTSLPRPVRTAVTFEGVEIEEVAGATYNEGDYVLASDLTARDRERAENGELDHLLEAVSLDEYEQASELARPTVIPEHEVERYIQLNDGKRVVERDQLISMKSAGAEQAKANLEAAKDAGQDKRPAITEQPSFVEVERDGEAGGVTEGRSTGPVVPKDAESVDEAVVEASGVEQPPGVPVGPTLAKAEGADPAEVDASTQKRTTRRRPGSHSSSGSTESSGSGSSGNS